MFTKMKSWKTFCTRIENRRRILDQIASELGICKLEDWYRVKVRDVRQGRTMGAVLLKYYKGSLRKCLEELHPEFVWKAWLFEKVPNGFWDVMANRKSYLQWISGEINIQKPADWFSVKQEEFIRRGGGGFLWKYRNSIQRALQDLFPENDVWKPWLFRQVNAHYWDSDEHVKSYMEWLAEMLGISRMSDWSTIPRQTINSLRGRTLSRKNPRLSDVFDRIYPDRIEMRMNSLEASSILMNARSPLIRKIEHERQENASKSQWHLMRLLQRIFPQEEILINVKHSSMVYSNSKLKMELDLFIPSFSLVLEYNGEQHYRWCKKYACQTETIRIRDLEKLKKCTELGYTLIEVPYWWDHRLESLLMAMERSRPDLQVSTFSKLGIMTLPFGKAPFYMNEMISSFDSNQIPFANSLHSLSVRNKRGSSSFNGSDHSTSTMKSQGIGCSLSAIVQAGNWSSTLILPFIIFL